MSHTCRTTGLGVGGVWLGRTVKIVLVGRRAGGRRRVQTVIRLRGVGRRNIRSNLRLRCVLRRRADLRLRGVVSSSSRILVCRFLFRGCVGDGVWVVRTWLCVLGSGPVVHKREDSRARMPTNLGMNSFLRWICVKTRRHNNGWEKVGKIDESVRYVPSKGTGALGCHVGIVADLLQI